MLVLAGFTLIGTLVAPPPTGPAAPPFPLAAIGIVTAVLFAGLSGWGIWTAIGIFRRRRWARVSFMIFAGLLTFVSAGAFVAMLVTPLPASQGVSQGMMNAVRWGIAGTYAVLLAIGVWWLVLFNLKSTPEYFGQAAASEPGARPLSVSLIGWYLSIGSLCLAAMAVMRVPAFVLGAVITGWGVPAVYAVYAGAQIFLGRGLLQMREWARVGSIGYFCFAALNSGLCMAPPGLTARMQIVQREMPRFFPAGASAPMPQPVWLLIPMGMAFCAVPIWFLVRRRGAFVKLGAVQQPV
jgi:hypothetical protein